jgi:hypothetical protein
MESAVWKERSASAASTCVRARTSVDLACTKVFVPRLHRADYGIHSDRTGSRHRKTAWPRPRGPCGLPLAECSFQIGVSGPDAILNLISRGHRLCPRCLRVVLGLRQGVLPGTSVEYRPAQTEADLPIETCGVTPGQCLLHSIE